MYLLGLCLVEFIEKASLFDASEKSLDQSLEDMLLLKGVDQGHIHIVFFFVNLGAHLGLLLLDDEDQVVDDVHRDALTLARLLYKLNEHVKVVLVDHHRADGLVLQQLLVMPLILRIDNALEEHSVARTEAILHVFNHAGEQVESLLVCDFHNGLDKTYYALLSPEQVKKTVRMHRTTFVYNS